MLIHEVRVAVRSLLRRRGLTLAALTTLTLGIGANAAVFSVIDGVLVKPLPYRQPEELLSLWPDHFFANREIQYLRDNLRTIDRVASVSPGWLMSLTGVAEPTEVDGGRVSGNLFELLDVRPLLGRTFGMETEVPGGEDVVVLSWGMWQTHFGGDRSIVGRSIMLGQRPYRVLAVMPRDFQVLDRESDLWYPLPMDPQAGFWAGQITLAFGRLHRGATLAAANQEFRAVTARMGTSFGHPDDYARAAGLKDLKEYTVGPLRLMMTVLFGAVLFILLIATANVANLLLTRATERRTEFALRAALGASRGALLRQLTIESLVLTLSGGLAGLLLAIAAIPAIRNLLPPETPRLQEIGIDWRAVAFCAAITLGAGLLIGIAPAFLTSGKRLIGNLRDGRTTTGAAQRARGLLIASEVALAVVLVCGTTLMLRTLERLHSIDPGFRTTRVLTFRLQPAGTPDELRAFWRTLLPRLAALPGVEAAGTVLHLPMGGRKWSANIEVEGVILPAGTASPRSAWQSVGGEYFRAMEIPLLRGRNFTEADDERAPRVAIVNAELAQMLWPNADPLGKRYRGGNATRQEYVTVIGVVGSVRHDSLAAAPEPEMYLPFAQTPIWANSVVLRTAIEPTTLAAAVRNTVWGLNREVPISQMRSIDEVLAASTVRRRVVMSLLGAFATVGMVLGIVGIYGLVAYSVRQRQREIGIRMALGATQGEVSQLMTRSGLHWAVLGLGTGILLTLALTRFMQGLIYGIAPRDPFTLIFVPLILLGVSWLAAWVPARRAAGISPATVLQQE